MTDDEAVRAAIESFTADTRVAARALAALLGTDIAGLMRHERSQRTGAGHVADGRRVVWRFHGAGVYIRLGSLRPVDFDFVGDAPSPTAVSELWKLKGCGRLPEQGPGDPPGWLEPGGRFRFEL